jgi:hypothetical protein
MRAEPRTFITVIMYGLKFEEDEKNEAKNETFYLQDQLILISDKFKNEVKFNE